MVQEWLLYYTITVYDTYVRSPSEVQNSLDSKLLDPNSAFVWYLGTYLLLIFLRIGTR